MAEKPYAIKDSRRVDEKGRRRNPQKVPGKTEIHFKDIGDALDSAFRYFRAQVEHLPGRDWPRSGEVRDLLRGFIISTQQLYAAAIILMADTRPKPLIMPAGVVARAAVEGLGNLLAIVEAPESASVLFLKDDYLNTWRRIRYFEQRFKNRPGIEKEKRKLTEYGRALKLTPEELADPEKHLAAWPTPRPLLERLTGERRAVFEEIYRFWYSALSALAHHRLTALQSAVFTEEQPDEETFLMAKSVTASLVLSVSLCVLAEIESFCSLAPCHPLRTAWERVRPADEIVESVYRLRYARLLKMGQDQGS